MLNNVSAVKVTLEIGPETNLSELMSHLALMQTQMPEGRSLDAGMLADFSVHEGELAPFETDDHAWFA